MSILINICYQQEGTAFFQYSVDFLQICLRIRPEIEAFYGDDLVKRVIFKWQLLNRCLQHGQFSFFHERFIKFSGFFNRHTRIIHASRMTSRQLLRHPVKGHSTAASNIQYLIVTFDLPVSKCPSGNLVMTVVHPVQHDFSFFPLGFSCDLFFCFLHF